MRRGRLASIAGAFAVAAVAIVSAGCGGGSSLALDPVAAAATKTQQAGAAHIRFSLHVSSPKFQGGQLRVRGDGAIDGTSAELTTHVGSLPGQIGLQSGASTKEIFVEQNGDYVLYLQPGALASQLPAGKHWVELDVSKLGQAAGIDLGQLMSGSQVSPGDLLSMLKAEGKVSDLGPATVDGVSTTHYRVTIDVAKALQAKGLTSPLLPAIVAKMPTVPADIWIGKKDGLVHRVQVSLGLARSQVSMTMDISDYGAHVTISAPPSSDVFDATQLAQQGIGSSSSSGSGTFNG